MTKVLFKDWKVTTFETSIFSFDFVKEMHFQKCSFIVFI
jgi:hypothetical protein